MERRGQARRLRGRRPQGVLPQPELPQVELPKVVPPKAVRPQVVPPQVVLRRAAAWLGSAVSAAARQALLPKAVPQVRQERAAGPERPAGAGRPPSGHHLELEAPAAAS